MIAYLRITSFMGMCIDAVHFYGHLRMGNVEHPLQRAMNATEARELSIKDGVTYREGDPTGRFDNREQLIAEAKKQWRQLLPLALYLVEGDPGYVEPHRLLAHFPGLEKQAAKISALWERQELLGPDPYRYAPEEAEELSTQWMELLAELGRIP